MAKAFTFSMAKVLIIGGLWNNLWNLFQLEETIYSRLNLYDSSCLSNVSHSIKLLYGAILVGVLSIIAPFEELCWLIVDAIILHVA